MLRSNHKVSKWESGSRGLPNSMRRWGRLEIYWVVFERRYTGHRSSSQVGQLNGPCVKQLALFTPNCNIKYEYLKYRGKLIPAEDWWPQWNEKKASLPKRLDTTTCCQHRLFIFPNYWNQAVYHVFSPQGDRHIKDP